MIQITAQMRVLVAIEPVDGRKGIDSLARLCREKLAEDPFSGCVFVFRSRSGTAIRLLTYDGQGYWLAQKRLSKGKFSWWPEAGEPALAPPALPAPAPGRPGRTTGPPGYALRRERRHFHAAGPVRALSGKRAKLTAKTRKNRGLAGHWSDFQAWCTILVLDRALFWCGSSSIDPARPSGRFTRLPGLCSNERSCLGSRGV